MAVHPHPDLRRTWRWCGKCSPAARINQHVRLLAKADCRGTRYVTVLEKDLNVRPWKPHYVQELTPEDCDRRMEYGELMLGWHEDWPQLFENILWSDEAVFHIGGFVNRHNCLYWAVHDPEVTLEKMQNRPKVTVWCRMTATRVIGPYLLHDTMNADRYFHVPPVPTLNFKLCVHIPI